MAESRNSTIEKLCGSSDILESSYDGSHSIFQMDVRHHEESESPRSPFVGEIYSLTPQKEQGNKNQRLDESTKHRPGFFKRLSQHITCMRKDQLQNYNSNSESPSISNANEADSYAIKDKRLSVEDRNLIMDSSERDCSINMTINKGPIPSSSSFTLICVSSLDESATEEPNDIPFMDEDPPDTNCRPISVDVHHDVRYNVGDNTDSDYRSNSPTPRRTTQTIFYDQDDVLSTRLVGLETIHNSQALDLEDRKFVELMCKLSVSNEKYRESQSISAYLKHVGVSSEKAKSFLEWLYLNDESLRTADKVGIGYEIETPDEPVYLALYSTFVPNLTCQKLYNTVKIIQRSIGCVSEEAHVISGMEITQMLEFSKAEQKRIHSCLAKNTPILMKEHSNLLMVSASKLKSEGFGTSHSKIYKNTCLVLYVDVKGFIPFGENAFPGQVEEFPVDVREGIFKTFSDPKDYHESLVMGCQIVTSYDTCGTLGAFVQLRDGYLGCLTCCHVFETADSVSDYRKDPMSLSFFKTEVFQPVPSNEYKFGNFSTFIHDPGDENSIGIDAALIVVNSPQRYPKSGDFPTLNCEIAGFSADNPPVFNSGEIIQSLDEIELPCHVVKYGGSTGLTIGLLRSFGSAVQERRPSFHPDDKVQLHQQLEVFSIERLFAEEGDSGSLVFCVCRKDETIVLKALGLLVGGSTNGNGIVTPIWAILNKMHLPLQLFCFDVSQRKYDKSALESSSLQMLKADVDVLKAGLSNVNSRLDVISTSMAKKEDIDKILQHLVQTNRN